MDWGRGMAVRGDEHGGTALVERRLRADQDAPRWARALATEIGRSLDNHTAASLYLAISELVTNAVVHGPEDDVTVRLERSGATVRVEVSDAGVTAFDPTGSPRDRTHGLEIVRAFTDRFGVDRRPNTVAWCELDLPADPLG
jgi:anti-sigma regulatory factor (Ser/Thr protein kinase)